MASLPTIPGFTVNTAQRDPDGFCGWWLAFFGGGKVAPNDWPPIVTFVVERPALDLPRLRKWYDEALDANMGFHIRVNPAALSDMGALDLYELRLEYPLATLAVGNGVGVGDGLDGLEYASATVLEDDAGVASAVYMARKQEPFPIAFHCYGEAGFAPARHLPLLRRWFPSQQFVITEGHWGFRTEKRPDRSDIYMEEAGLWCRDLVIEAHKADIPVCLFRGIDFMRADGTPHNSLYALRDGGFGDWTRGSSRVTRSMWWQRLRPW